MASPHRLAGGFIVLDGCEGCGKSTQTARLAKTLEAAGLSSVVVAGGMEAWRAALLPTTRDNRNGVSYVSLLLKVRRPGKAEKTAHAAH